jgi:hypothetical protein
MANKLRAAGSEFALLFYGLFDCGLGFLELSGIEIAKAQVRQVQRHRPKASDLLKLFQTLFEAAKVTILRYKLSTLPARLS